ncbi:MAG: hypothetical protein ACRD5F_00205 [Candidatus Acidiferrales bacterium]
MKLVLASNGSYPRSGDAPEWQCLRRTVEAFARGETTAADLADAQKEMTRHAIAEQAQAGIEVLTDGMIRWQDPISHVAGKLRGVRLGETLPYFNTGINFRQPVLTAKPTRDANGAGGLVSEFQFARNALGQLPTAMERAGRLAMKPVLVGPYTLARLSRAEHSAMQALEARAAAFAEAVAGEFLALIAAGADLVQVDEPALASHPEEFSIFAAALRALCDARDQARKSGREARLALCVNLGDTQPIYEQLAQLPVDALLLDFTASATLAAAVAAVGSPIPLGLGVVDGTNPEVEDAGTIARRIEPVVGKLPSEYAFLGPSAGLERLPRDRAYAKLALLAEIRSALMT